MCEYAAILRDFHRHHHCRRDDSMPRETNSRTSILTCIILLRKRARRGPSWASQTELCKPERMRRLLESGTQQVPLLSRALADPASSTGPVVVAIIFAHELPFGAFRATLAIPAGRYTQQRPFLILRRACDAYFLQPRAGSGAARTPQPPVRLSYIWARAADLGQRW